MSNFFKPILWNRSLIAWINLEIAILNLIVVVISYYPLRILNSFLAGMCFSDFIYDGIINNYSHIVRRAMRHNKILKEISDKK